MRGEPMHQPGRCVGCGTDLDKDPGSIGSRCSDCKPQRSDDDSTCPNCGGDNYYGRLDARGWDAVCEDCEYGDEDGAGNPKHVPNRAGHPNRVVDHR